MKNFFSIFLIMVLLAAVLSGCGGKPAAEQGSGEAEVKAAETQAAGDMEKATEKAMEAMETLMNKEWPKDKLPSELPEYTGGEIANSGGDSKEFIVKIDKTTEEALNSYLGKLEDLGWYVEDSRETIVTKGIYEIRFNWQGEDHLQMALYTSEAGEWPADKLPPDVIPPENCTFIGDMEVLESVPGQAWYITYTCEGIDEEAANAYFRKLNENGWSGDSQLVKDIEWNGKKYRADIEIYEIQDDTTSFTLNFVLAE